MDRKLRQIHNRVLSLGILIFLLPATIVRAQDIMSSEGMVASAHPLASRAGIQILQSGGNAVDAMVATALALGVVEPNASGLGGGGFMTLKTKGKDPVTIDFRETAPLKATGDFYYMDEKAFKNLTASGPFSIGIPGTVAGLSMALKNYGSLSFAEVAKPAIAYAEDGFVVSENLETIIFEKYDLLLADEASSAIYLNEGLPISAGERIKNPDLAKTLRVIAQNGAGEFYGGELGQRIVASVQNKGGNLLQKDLEMYRAIIKKPLKGNYRGYDIVSSAPPSGGGTHLIELLNILARYDLKKMGHNSADYIHIFAEAEKMVLADKARNMGDPDFYDVPVKKLTKKRRARKLSRKIDIETACFDYVAPDWISRSSGSTTHLSVVDKDGNMVALTQSINFWFGAGICADGTGILMNNHLSDFDREPGHANSIEAGKRPVSSIAPTLVLKDGEGYLTLGTPGGSRIIAALAQVIVNIIDFDMAIDDAIEAARVHSTASTLHVEGRIPGPVREELTSRGHNLKVHDDFDNYFGGAQGIRIDPQNKTLTGGADSRRDGVAIGL